MRMTYIDRLGYSHPIRHYDDFRRRVSKGRPRNVAIHGNAIVVVTTEEGVLAMSFPSRQALKTALMNWRSLYGLRLIVGNKTIGWVGRQLPKEF